MLARNRQSVWGRTYKDLPIKSDYRVHDVAFDIIGKRFTQSDVFKVLDIATGIGALSQRLVDHFPACELHINDFEHEARISGAKKYHVDLNRDFANEFDSQGYDVIVAVEIIEHLENPWHFLRTIRRILKDGGLLVLSTPNVDSTLDRLTCLIEGHPFYFGERGYTNSGGHITQVPDWLVKKIAANSGYTAVELFSDVDTAPHVGVVTSLRKWLAMPLAGLLMRNRNDRSINVYRCQ